MLDSPYPALSCKPPFPAASPDGTSGVREGRAPLSRQGGAWILSQSFSDFCEPD